MSSTVKNLKQFKEYMQNFNIQQFKETVYELISKVSTETFGWLGIVVLHSATIPSMLAVMTGLTDNMPPVDMVLLVWTGLALMFIKSAVQRDMLSLITIGVGFIVQAVMMALIFFK